MSADGLGTNFNLVQEHFGDTAHVREFDAGGYPYQKLIELLVGMGYDGWVLLECRGKRDDLVAAYAKQRKLFDEMVARALAANG